MSKTIIENKEKSFELIADDAGTLVLNVLCGGIGMFIAKLPLNQDELQQYQANGTDYIEELAYDISTNTEKYRSRMT